VCWNGLLQTRCTQHMLTHLSRFHHAVGSMTSLVTASITFFVEYRKWYLLFLSYDFIALTVSLKLASFYQLFYIGLCCRPKCVNCRTKENACCVCAGSGVSWSVHSLLLRHQMLPLRDSIWRLLWRLRWRRKIRNILSKQIQCLWCSKRNS